jgi:rhodanese-related sulfurtransferase
MNEPLSLHARASLNPAGYGDVTPAQVAEAEAEAEAAAAPEGHRPPRLVDVRAPEEYTGELGHAPRSELLPLGSLENAAEDWDRDEEIVLLCRSGARSGRGATLLASMGFRRVMNMVGGMLAWNAAGLPIER